MSKSCPECKGRGLVVVDFAADGSPIEDACPGCKEIEASRLEAQAEDAAESRRESWELQAKYEGGPRPPHYVPPLGMPADYDGLD